MFGPRSIFHNSFGGLIFYSFKPYIVGNAGLRIVFAVRCFPFEHEFVLAIAVKVADTASLDCSGRCCQRNIDVAARNSDRLLGRRAFNAVCHRLDRISPGAGAVVLITGCIRDDRGIELCCAFVHIKPKGRIRGSVPKRRQLRKVPLPDWTATRPRSSFP